MSRDMSEKYLRHRQSFNLSHFFGPNLLTGCWLWLWRQVHRSLMTSRWRKCVCVWVSCLPGTCSLQRNHFYNWHAASQRRNCKIERKKKKEKKSNGKCEKKTKSELCNAFSSLLAWVALSAMSADTTAICLIWHYINWNDTKTCLAAWSQLCSSFNKITSAIAPSIK